MTVGNIDEAKNFSHQMDVIEKGMIYIHITIFCSNF